MDFEVNSTLLDPILTPDEPTKEIEIPTLLRITLTERVGSEWYYLYSDGSMSINTTIEYYRVDESGAWV